MWIVQLALRRPYTFVVMALLIAILGVVTVQRMSTDIFPEIDIPIVSVIWSYNGISAEEMEKRIVTSSERGLTTTVNDIEHIESQSLNGVAVIRVYFHPGAKIEAATAQITAMSQSIIRVLPPGTTSVAWGLWASVFCSVVSAKSAKAWLSCSTFWKTWRCIGKLLRLRD